jgi:hypothetical protein
MKPKTTSKIIVLLPVFQNLLFRLKAGKRNDYERNGNKLSWTEPLLHFFVATSKTVQIVSPFYSRSRNISAARIRSVILHCKRIFPFISATGPWASILLPLTYLILTISKVGLPPLSYALQPTQTPIQMRISRKMPTHAVYSFILLRMGRPTRKNGRLHTLRNISTRRRQCWKQWHLKSHLLLSDRYRLLQPTTTSRAVIATMYNEKRNSILSPAYNNLPFFRNNRTANGVLRDVVHRIYQGVLYFQNFMRFYGTRVNVISFMAIESTAFPVPIFTKLTLAQYTAADIDCAEFYPSRTKNV